MEIMRICIFLFGLLDRMMLEDDEQSEKSSRIPHPNAYTASLTQSGLVLTNGKTGQWRTFQGLVVDVGPQLSEREVRASLAVMEDEWEKTYQWYCQQAPTIPTYNCICKMKQEVLFIAQALTKYEIRKAQGGVLDQELEWLEQLGLKKPRFVTNFKGKIGKLAIDLSQTAKPDQQATLLESFLLSIHQSFLEKTKSYRFEERRHQCSAAESEQESLDIQNIAKYIEIYLQDYCKSFPE